MTKPTISDVAREAGVSMKSVSRVINGEPNVSLKLRAKVDTAIDALGYVPDIAARSLAAGRSFTIGLLFEDFGDAMMPSYLALCQLGAQRACRERSYHLLLETIESDGTDFESRFTRMLSTMSVDGLILPPPFADNLAALGILEARQIPYVRIAPSVELSRAPYVAIDDEAGAAEIARHLWGLGHRRFGFILGRDGHPAAEARHKGFTETLAALGGCSITTAEGKFVFESGIAAAESLADSGVALTAIFAANDDSAAGAMAGLAHRGLKVPHDVSIAGFDDSWIALSVWPYLTTVHQPITEMARVAAAMLIERNGALDEKRAVILDHHLVVRGSTAAPRP